MMYLLSPLFGSSPHTAAPTSGAEPAVQAARSNEGQLPFHSLLNQQLQLLQLMQQPGVTATQFPAMPTHSPWQSFAGGGQSFPFAPAGTTPSAGITLESVTYSRISLNGSEILNTLDGAMGQDPQNILAELLAHLGERPAEEVPVSGNTEVIASQTDKDTPDTEAANHLAASSEDLNNPQYLGEKIGKAVANISNAQVPNAQFAVDHPRYGRIEARVDIADDTVNLAFGVQDPELRAVLEAATVDIERALGEKGLALDKLEVGPPEDAPEVVTPEIGEELVSSYTSQLDAALSRIISDLALGVTDNRA